MVSDQFRSRFSFPIGFMKCSIFHNTNTETIMSPIYLKCLYKVCVCVCVDAETEQGKYAVQVVECFPDVHKALGFHPQHHITWM